MRFLLLLIGFLVSIPGNPLFAQGLLVFNNNTATAITNLVTGTRANVKVALYYSIVTNATRDSLVFANGVSTNTFTPGLFIGGTRSIPGAPAGTFIRAQLRVWTGSAASYEEAIHGVSEYWGESALFIVGPLGGGINVVPTLVGSGLTPILFPVLGPNATYSVNAIGYADIRLEAGSNLVSNPFNAGDNSVSNLFRGIPTGSYFIDTPNGPTNAFSVSAGWSNPDVELIFPRGGCLWVPTSTNLTFVGDVWIRQSSATYSAGEWFLGAIPGAGANVACGGFTDPCPTDPPVDGLQVRKWNPQTQTWADPASYLDGLGWIPQVPAISPGEGVVIDSPATFQLLRPNVGPRLQRVRVSPRRDIGFTVQFPATNSVSYCLLQSTNLNSNVWRVADSGTLTPSGGVASLNVPGATGNPVFYRIVPGFSLTSTVMLSPVREGNSFSFEWYAFQGEFPYVVVVEKTLALANPPSASLWQEVATLRNGLNTVTRFVDTSATAARAYYRVRNPSGGP